MGSSINYMATGSIYPSRFCMNDLTTPYAAKQANVATQPLIGISQEGTHDGPGTSADDGLAAASGEWLKIYADEDHDECLLYLGAAVTGGQLLKSDANGLGVPVAYDAATIQCVGAEARDNGASGDLIRVRPRFDVLPPFA